MSETLYKGWLTTRDNKKYAPATLIENVFTRNNTPYDAKVREYIEDAKAETNQQIASINSTLLNQAETLTDLRGQDIELANKLANFDGSDNDTLYIVDNLNRVIAYVNDTGVNSIDFTIPGVTSLLQTKSSINNINSQIADIQENILMLDGSLENIDTNNDDTLYIIDKDENVIAYINDQGVHSINFIIDNQLDYLSLLSVVEDNINKINELKASNETIMTSIASLSSNVENRLKNFNGDDTDTLYITDNEERVIAYIDNEGIHTTTLNIQDGIKQEESVLYIVDGSDQVVAYIDNQGIHSINFLIDDENGLVYNLIGIIEELKRSDTQFSTLFAATVSALEGKIADEATARDTDITEVKKLINKEKLERESKNTELLKAIEEERNSRETANATLSSNLSNEAILRAQADRAINFVGVVTVLPSTGSLGDICIFNNKLYTYNGTSWDEDFEGLSKKLYYLDGSADNTLYITDKDENVIAYVNQDGIHSVNFYSEKLDKDGKLIVTANLNSQQENIVNLMEQISNEISSRTTFDQAISKTINFLGEFSSNPYPANEGDICLVNNTLKIYKDNEWVECDPLSVRIENLKAEIGTEEIEEGTIKTHIISLKEGLSNERNERVNNFNSLSTSITNEIANRATADEEIEADIDVLQAKTKYLNASSDDALYVIDNDENVIVKVDQSGILTTDVITKGFIYDKIDDGDKGTYRIVSANTEGVIESSINEYLVQLLNQDLDLQTITASQTELLKELKDKVNNVSNVMDFIGAFETLDNLKDYENPNNGDVAIVTKTATEYVYLAPDWIEIGNSEATSTAIANLQNIIGRTEQLGTGEESHEQRLKDHNDSIKRLKEQMSNVIDTTKDIEILYQIIGEDKKPDTSDQNHKNRLDNIEKLIGNGNSENDGTHEARLDNLEALVGNGNSENDGTHETRLDNLESSNTNQNNSINSILKIIGHYSNDDENNENNHHDWLIDHDDRLDVLETLVGIAENPDEDTHEARLDDLESIVGGNPPGSNSESYKTHEDRLDTLESSNTNQNSSISEIKKVINLIGSSEKPYPGDLQFSSDNLQIYTDEGKWVNFDGLSRQLYNKTLTFNKKTTHKVSTKIIN